MNEKHSSGTSMWAWRTALGVVPTNAFEKDIKACAEALDAARLKGHREMQKCCADMCREYNQPTAVQLIENLSEGGFGGG